MISQNFKKIFLLWGPVVLWCGLIFIMSSMPTLPKVGFIWWDFLMKKSAHIIEYGILYFLLWRALKGNTKRYLISLILGLLYAISDEYHQSFVMGRTAMARDVGFDLLGMLIALYWLKKKVKN